MSQYPHARFQPDPEYNSGRFQKDLHQLESALPMLFGEVDEEATGNAPHKKAEELIQLGNTHYNSFLAKSQKKELDLAIDCYRKALKSNPNLSEGYVKLASALYDKGQLPIENAIQFCQRALEMNPANAEANLFLGYFLRLSGNVEGAMAQYEIAIRKAPLRSAKPRMAYGRMLIQQASQRRGLPATSRLGLTLRGLWQFSSGMLLLPADSSTVDVLKSSLVKDTQIYTVLGLAKTVSLIGLQSASAWLYHLGTEKMPGEPVFYHVLGDFYARKKKTDSAIYYYSRATELQPENTALHKKLASLYHQHQDVQQTAASLEKVVEQNPDDFDSTYHLAQIYVDRGEYIRALYYLKELGNKQAKNPYIHSNMAYVLFKLEDYDGAIKEYQAAVSYGEDAVWTATVAQTLGTIYYQLKHDTKNAVQMFQMAYQLDPNNLEAVTMLADLYLEQGNLEAAIGAYQYILNFEPDNADCYSYIGYLLWQMDKNDEAEAYYLKAIAFDPECYVAYNNLGVIYLDEENNAEKALEMFRMAYELKPDYTLACFNTGRALEDLGHTSEAARHYSQALALNSDSPELTSQEIMERLDHLFSV